MNIRKGLKKGGEIVKAGVKAGGRNIKKSIDEYNDDRRKEKIWKRETKHRIMEAEYVAEAEGRQKRAEERGFERGYYGRFHGTRENVTNALDVLGQVGQNASANIAMEHENALRQRAQYGDPFMQDPRMGAYQNQAFNEILSQGGIPDPRPAFALSSYLNMGMGMQEQAPQPSRRRSGRRGGGTTTVNVNVVAPTQQRVGGIRKRRRR